MDKLKVYIENRQKKVKIPSGLRLLVRRCCYAILLSEKFEGNAEVNVIFVDDEQIQSLNSEYRDIPQPTDVLSFPMGENRKFDKNPETGAYILGDIVISLERAAIQAEKYSRSLQEEVAFLTAHSMLHILGYDHAGGVGTMRMREHENAVLAALGFEAGAL
jgi:probable rRNA maturation factor